MVASVLDMNKLCSWMRRLLVGVRLGTGGVFHSWCPRNNPADLNSGGGAVAPERWP